MIDKPIFNDVDVIIVATAMIENCLQWDNSYQTTIGGTCGYICRYCENEPITETEEEYIHKLLCPVLVAQDLLT